MFPIVFLILEPAGFGVQKQVPLLENSDSAGKAQGAVAKQFPLFPEIHRKTF